MIKSVSLADQAEPRPYHHVKTVISGFRLVLSFSMISLNISEGEMTKKLIPYALRGSQPSLKVPSGQIGSK